MLSVIVYSENICLGQQAFCVLIAPIPLVADPTCGSGANCLLMKERTVSNILKACVVIKGTRPLIQNHFGANAIPLEKQERTGVAGNDPEEWRDTCMVTKNGQLFLDPTNVFACLRDGARYTKKGRGSIQSLVAATLQVADDIVLIDRWYPSFPNKHEFDPKTAQPPPTDKTLPVFLDISSVRNPQTKARNVRYRVTASTGWTLTFHVVWDKTIVSREQLQAVCIDAGTLVGIGDGRSVGYGRFSIESFEIVE